MRPWLWPVLGFGSLLALWSAIIVLFQVRPFIAPAPWDVAAALWTERHVLLLNLWPTLGEALMGFVFGNSLAVLVAIAFVHVPALRRMYFPCAVVFNTVPIIALAPILILMFGLGMLPKVIIAGIICFFPTLVNLSRGLESHTANEMELMRVMSASPWEILLRLRLPRSLPFLFSALRITSASCVIGAIVGEWIGSTSGIGALIIQATFNYRSSLLYAAIVLSSGVALTLFSLVVATEKRVVRW